MATKEAIYANGESLLPQDYAAGNIEPAYANGESGGVPFDKYIAKDSFIPCFRRRRR
jgi:hypothetical protein